MLIRGRLIDDVCGRRDEIATADSNARPRAKARRIDIPHFRAVGPWHGARDGYAVLGKLRVDHRHPTIPEGSTRPGRIVRGGHGSPRAARAQKLRVTGLTSTG
jgi:hypothetical protein